MYMAAEMMSILLAVRPETSALNGIGSIATLNPASLAMAVMRSTMKPWMVLVLVSRKVKGTPVAVEPTRNASSARVGWANDKTMMVAAVAAREMRRRNTRSPDPMARRRVDQFTRGM